MSKKFALGNVATKPQPLAMPVQSMGVFKTDEPLMDTFRKKLNEALIEKLKSVYLTEYGSDKWKYRLIKNVRLYQKQELQYVQLQQIENGSNYTINSLMMILVEIARLDSSFDIQVFKDGVQINK